MKVKAIEVVRYEDEEVVNTVTIDPPRSESYADRVERGMLINMNHKLYFTRQVYAD